MTDSFKIGDPVTGRYRPRGRVKALAGKGTIDDPLYVTVVFPAVEMTIPAGKLADSVEFPDV